jgi:hypothetical protein
VTVLGLQEKLKDWSCWPRGGRTVVPNPYVPDRRQNQIGESLITPLGPLWVALSIVPVLPPPPLEQSVWLSNLLSWIFLHPSSDSYTLQRCERDHGQGLSLSLSLPLCLPLPLYIFLFLFLFFFFSPSLFFSFYTFRLGSSSSF